MVINLCFVPKPDSKSLMDSQSKCVGNCIFPRLLFNHKDTEKELGLAATSQNWESNTAAGEKGPTHLEAGGSATWITPVDSHLASPAHISGTMFDSAVIMNVSEENYLLVLVSAMNLSHMVNSNYTADDLAKILKQVVKIWVHSCHNFSQHVLIKGRPSLKGVENMS